MRLGLSDLRPMRTLADNKVTDTTQSFPLPAIQPTQTKRGFTRLLAVLYVVLSGYSACKRIYFIIILPNNN